MSIAKKRTLVFYGFIFATAIFLMVSYITVSDGAFQHEAYQHAAEASLLEGQAKPEGHGR